MLPCHSTTLPPILQSQLTTPEALLQMEDHRERMTSLWLGCIIRDSLEIYAQLALHMTLADQSMVFQASLSFTWWAIIQSMQNQRVHRV